MSDEPPCIEQILNGEIFKNLVGNIDDGPDFQEDVDNFSLIRHLFVLITAGYLIAQQVTKKGSLSVKTSFIICLSLASIGGGINWVYERARSDPATAALAGITGLTAVMIALTVTGNAPSDCDVLAGGPKEVSRWEWASTSETRRQRFDGSTERLCGTMAERNQLVNEDYEESDPNQQEQADRAAANYSAQQEANPMKLMLREMRLKEGGETEDGGKQSFPDYDRDDDLQAPQQGKKKFPWCCGCGGRQTVSVNVDEDNNNNRNGDTMMVYPSSSGFKYQTEEDRDISTCPSKVGPSRLAYISNTGEKEESEDFSDNQGDIGFYRDMYRSQPKTEIGTERSLCHSLSSKAPRAPALFCYTGNLLHGDDKLGRDLIIKRHGHADQEMCLKMSRRPCVEPDRDDEFLRRRLKSRVYRRKRSRRRTLCPSINQPNCEMINANCFYHLDEDEEDRCDPLPSLVVKESNRPRAQTMGSDQRHSLGRRQIESSGNSRQSKPKFKLRLSKDLASSALYGNLDQVPLNSRRYSPIDDSFLSRSNRTITSSEFVEKFSKQLRLALALIMVCITIFCVLNSLVNVVNYGNAALNKSVLSRHHRFDNQAWMPPPPPANSPPVQNMNAASPSYRNFHPSPPPSPFANTKQSSADLLRDIMEIGIREAAAREAKSKSHQSPPVHCPSNNLKAKTCHSSSNGYDPYETLHSQRSGDN